MFSEKRLLRFQASSEDWGGEPDYEDDQYLAFTVFDGVYPTRFSTLSAAMSDANSRMGIGDKLDDGDLVAKIIDSDVQELSPETPVNQNIVVIQGNTQTAIVQVLQGEYTPAIERFVTHRYSEYSLGKANLTEFSPFMHESHILFQEDLQARKLKSLFSVIAISLCAEYLAPTKTCPPMIIFSTLEDKAEVFRIIYDSNVTEHYILLDDNCEEIEKFSNATELENILIQQKSAP